MSKPKSSVPATTKALQAWQSELRRLEKRLEEWSNDLAEREENLEQQEAAFADAVENADGETVQLYADHFSHDDDEDDGMDCDENDCGCTPEDAASNCDCPKCTGARRDWVKAGDEILPPGSRIDISRAFQRQPVGDEVKWLENLWKLKDDRKKK
jgi:hypothetical protein